MTAAPVTESGLAAALRPIFAIAPNRLVTAIDPLSW